MLLEGRSAVACGSGGKVGGAVARAFDHEEARVFLAGRTRETLEAVAEEIRFVVGAAEPAPVDAFDKRRGEENESA
ncbi:MAG: hypothetical protein AVDCRST_MAG37-2061 [uncultured Rubrobacteraceae bacterium]|uniref:Uncharacterized protein n=1 Tax=uncultured Rubrobacteraceae bacterium TaxID=349277 RepID=A0A6J4QLD3_9ACTN|nr:MAG: hypothetical protein AVDCRST_MAG37-2061 [uncultured Rubrobacteraceae bacterium]